jgi:hypothetical protein
MSNWFIDLRGVQGKFVANANFGRAVIDRHAVVVASVVEIGQPQGEPLDFPFIGNADNMLIKNVCPQDDGIVRFVVDTDWSGDPINVRLNMIVNPA